MREIISIHVGQCGNNIGKQFWEVVSKEHSISPMGTYNGNDERQVTRLPVFYVESSTGRYVPRATFVDLEPRMTDVIQATEYGTLYHPNSFLTGRIGAANNWAKGYYTEGAVFAPVVLDYIRKLSEMCSNVEGFKMFHSLGGGTGSGLGALLIKQLGQEYPDRHFMTYSVYPSPVVSDVVVEPYNALLTQQKLVENVNQVVCLDNAGLYDLSVRVLQIPMPTYENLNQLISYITTGVTSSLRFPGQLNSGLKKIGVSMIPFPIVHFFAPVFAPLLSKPSWDYAKLTTRDLTTEVFYPEHVMCAIDPSAGKYITVNLVLRGDICTKDVDLELLKIQNEERFSFVDWIPNNIKTTLVDVPHHGYFRSVTSLISNTEIRSVFQRIQNEYEVMHKKQVFVHWYTQEGMDPEHFEEVFSVNEDLVNVYSSYAKDPAEDEE